MTDCNSKNDSLDTEQEEMVTVFLKGGKEKQVPISEIEIWLTERIDETEARHIPLRRPCSNQLKDDKNVFPESSLD